MIYSLTILTEYNTITHYLSTKELLMESYRNAIQHYRKMHNDTIQSVEVIEETRLHSNFTYLQTILQRGLEHHFVITASWEKPHDSPCRWS